MNNPRHSPTARLCTDFTSGLLEKGIRLGSTPSQGETRSGIEAGRGLANPRVGWSQPPPPQSHHPPPHPVRPCIPVIKRRDNHGLISASYFKLLTRMQAFLLWLHHRRDTVERTHRFTDYAFPSNHNTGITHNILCANAIDNLTNRSTGLFLGC